MAEYNPCNSCWVNLGNCNGVGVLAICCGSWCFKGPVMEHHDPNCCYCFELSGFGCNLCCLGCVCCHPPWFSGYVHKYFNQNHHNQPQYPTPNPTYFPQNPNPNPQFKTTIRILITTTACTKPRLQPSNPMCTRTSNSWRLRVPSSAILKPTTPSDNLFPKHSSPFLIIIPYKIY